MGRIIVVALALLLPVSAQAQPTGGTEVWAGTQSISSSGVDRKEVLYARLQAWANFGRFGSLIRLDATGTPGKFVGGDPATFQSGALAVAFHWDALRVQDASCGPAVAAEYSVLLETKEGYLPTTPNLATILAAGRCSYRGTVVYAGIGMNQELPGFGGRIATQIPLGDWAAWQVEAGMSEHRTYIVKMATAVRFGWGGKK